MEVRVLGCTGVQVPVIGQGTWKMGQSDLARGTEMEALALGIELGMCHIDTAEMYAGAEELVGRVMRRFRRSDLFIASKVLPGNASYRGTIRALEASLRRLGTEYLDLYLLHWPSHHPLAETMGALETLVAQGKIRFLGVSNFNREELQEACGLLTHERIACNQVMYNLGARGIELDLLPFCEQEGIAVVGYTPFGSLPSPGSQRWQALEEVARRHAKTVHQVVLRFLTRRAALFTIPKAANSAHVRENAGATGFTLTEADIQLLDGAFPAPPAPVPLAMN